MQPHHSVIRLLARQHGLITRRQALQLGVAGSRIDRLLDAGTWERVHRGVYRLAGTPPTWHQRVLAGCLAAGWSAAASHRSAAKLWGLPVALAGVDV